MKITGIICEYNPFHLGHFKQINTIHEHNPDGAVVALMSGNFVQRGYPAIFDKSYRAQAAIMSGADLVLELPVSISLSSAEGFAFGGVRILSDFCDSLSFGAENPNTDTLLSTAQALLSPEFSVELKQALSTGRSFPAARQTALKKMGLDDSILSTPNNILAVEYCKAILSQNSNLTPEPILRQGNYHDLSADRENPSATAVRILIENEEFWQQYVPKDLVSLFENAPVHTLDAGERAILYRLRTMTDAEFEALPYGSEGLWRKLMKNAQKYASLEEILTATKSKRYTRTRLDRMIMCAFLGLSAEDISSPAPYARVLALNDKGRDILLKARQAGCFPNIGEKIDHPWQALENRCDDLYGLFTRERPASAGIAEKRRIYYQKEV